MIWWLHGKLLSNFHQGYRPRLDPSPKYLKASPIIRSVPAHRSLTLFQLTSIFIRGDETHVPFPKLISLEFRTTSSCRQNILLRCSLAFPSCFLSFILCVWIGGQPFFARLGTLTLTAFRPSFIYAVEVCTWIAEQHAHSRFLDLTQ